MRFPLELLAVVVLLETLLWLPRDGAELWFAASALALIGVVSFSWRRLRPWQARHAAGEGAARRAWLEVLGATLALSIALVGVCYLGWEACDEPWIGDEPESLAEAAGIAGVEVGVALAQQVVLMWILLPLCREGLGRATSLVVVSVLFGALHLPSPALTLLTSAGAAVWIALYLRHERLAPLVAGHVVLAVLAHGLLPQRWSHDMRVGSRAQERIYRYEALEHAETRVILSGICTPEFQSAHPTDAAYVSALYDALLDRAPASDDLASWTNYLQTHTRAKTARRIAASRERWRLLQR